MAAHFSGSGCHKGRVSLSGHDHVEDEGNKGAHTKPCTTSTKAMLNRHAFTSTKAPRRVATHCTDMSAGNNSHCCQLGQDILNSHVNILQPLNLSTTPSWLPACACGSMLRIVVPGSTAATSMASPRQLRKFMSPGSVQGYRAMRLTCLQDQQYCHAGCSGCRTGSWCLRPQVVLGPLQSTSTASA